MLASLKRHDASQSEAVWCVMTRSVGAKCYHQKHSMPSTKRSDTVTPEAFLAGYSSDVRAIANTLRQLVKATLLWRATCSDN